MNRKLWLPLVAVLAGCSDASTDGPGTTDGAPRDAHDALAIDTTDATDASCTLHKAYSSKNAACNACAQEHCCGAVNGCFDDPRCDDDYVNCILACALVPDDAGPDAGDATGACLADCRAQYPAGKAEYDTAIGCVDGACADACK